MQYIYTIRNKLTGNLQTARCGKGGKFYESLGFAKNRCAEFNKYGYNTIDYNFEQGEFEVVKYELYEVETM